MTVISDSIRSVSGVPDDRQLTFACSVLRDSGGGDAIVSTRFENVTPVDGEFSVDLDPGPAEVVIRNQTFKFVVPVSGPSRLWPLIEDYVPVAAPVVNAAAAARDAAVAAKDAAQDIADDLVTGVVPDAGVAARVAASGSATRSAVDARVTAVGNATYAPQSVVSDVAAKYTKPGPGIPKADLVSAVQASLTKADASGTKADYNVKDYGAVGNGTTDDTTALQAAITAAVAGKGRLIWPPGTYKISSALLMGTSSSGSTNWEMSGTGVTIMQDTNNTPIFKFTKELTRNFVIRGFEFAWTNNQASTNTLAIGIYFDSDTNNNYGFYNFEVCNVIFRNGYRGICVNEGSANTIPVWGANLHDWHHSSGMSGAAIRLVQTASGQPNIRLANIYLRGDIATEEGIIIQGAASVAMQNIEFNKYIFREMILTTCDAVEITAIRSEDGTLSSNFGGIWTFSDCRFRVSGWQVQKKEFNVAGWAYVFRLLSGNTTAVIGTGGVASLTITAGQVAVVSGDAVADIQFDGGFRNGSGIVKVYKFDNTSTHVSRDRGVRGSVITKTASYTATDADDIIICNGSSVTITLPAPSATLSHPNRIYTVKNINSAAATVANSALIDGSSSVSLAQWEVGRYLNTGATWLKI